MAIQKNFVVKNGIEVNDNLIFADKDQNTVGIGTTTTPERLQVNGGIGATSIVVIGVGTFPTVKSTNALISNGYINVGIVTTLSGTISTYTTSNATTLNATTGNIVTGVVTSVSGTNLIYTTGNVTTLNVGNLNAVSGVVTSITGTGLTYTTGNLGNLNATTGNIVTGVVTTISGTTATYTNANVTILNGNTVLTPNLYAISGVVTSISGSSLDYTDLSGSRLNLTGIATIGVATIGIVGIGTLNVSGISTLNNLTVTPVGGGATVGSYSGIVTYYGDGSGLFNTPPGSPAGSDTQVQYNNSGSFSGSSNFIFDGNNVVVGSAVTINSTGIILTGIASATGFVGTFSGTSAIFSGNSTHNIVRITQTGTGNALVVEDSTNPDTTPFVITGIGSVGIGTNAPINTLDVHGTIRAARQDAVSDGGEIVLARASDNANAWALDVHTNSFRVTDVIAGSTRVHINSDGNVGIGSTATSKLHVFGNARVTGILTVGSSSITIDGVNDTIRVGTGVTISASTGLTGSGANLTSLNASNLSSGTVPTARLASGTANSSTYLRGDQTWASITTGITITDDTSTDETRYLTFTSATSGTITGENVSSTKLTFNPSTGLLTVVDINSTSDINLKTNINTVENALDTVSQLRGVSFDWKETGKSSYGVIAQEIEEFLPELVASEEVKSVNYNGLVGVLIEAIKELKSEIEELKNSK